MSPNSLVVWLLRGDKIVLVVHAIQLTVEEMSPNRFGVSDLCRQTVPLRSVLITTAVAPVASRNFVCFIQLINIPSNRSKKSAASLSCGRERTSLCPWLRRCLSGSTMSRWWRAFHGWLREYRSYLAASIFRPHLGHDLKSSFMIYNSRDWRVVLCIDCLETAEMWHTVTVAIVH